MRVGLVRFLCVGVHVLVLSPLVACDDAGKPSRTGRDTETDTGSPDDSGGSDSGVDDSSQTTDDRDADGFSLDAGDCDDNDPTIYPGASDAPYDGVDSDCAGDSDDDADRDGFDDAGRGGEDCDDADPSRNPAASEVYGDGIDSDCDGYADVALARCESAFELSFPDGSVTTLDGCAAFDMNVGYEFDPDSPPQVTSLQIAFNAWADAAFECSLSVQVDAVCGTGFYPLGDPNRLLWATFDCTGVADGYENSFDGGFGWVELTEIDTGTTSGNFSGRPLGTAVAATLWGRSEDGTVIEGTFAVSAEQVADDDDIIGVCLTVDGDADGDGAVSPSIGGTDCDDTNASVFPGDGDGDGYDACGSPGTRDCDDSDAAVYPGEGCRSYTSMRGTFGVAGYGADVTEGGAVTAARVCPTCEFTFADTSPWLGWSNVYYAFDADTDLLYFVSDYFGDRDGYFYGGQEWGPFSAELTYGTTYDLLTWGGRDTFYGLSFYGTFRMY